MKRAVLLVSFFWTLPWVGTADPALECGVGLQSQVMIEKCVDETTFSVDQTIDIALGLAFDAAKELDSETGRDIAVPSLMAGQAAWNAYREAHCDYVGSFRGGVTDTKITLGACRIELGRERVAELMKSLDVYRFRWE